jgi:hypothetical protein
MLTISLSPGTWTSLGPAPINGGQESADTGFTNVSGRITGLAESPNGLGVKLYAATAGGGIWETSDFGNSWTPLTDDVTDLGGNPVPLFMGSVAVAPSNSQVLYAGTGEANNGIDSYYGEGILVSTDGGQTWTLTGQSQFQGRAIGKIAVDPWDPNTAYAAVSDQPANGSAAKTGIWKTTNAGQTWTNMTQNAGLTTTDSWTDVVIEPNTPQGNYLLFAAVGNISPAKNSNNNGVYESLDAGADWTPAGNFPMGSGGRIALAISHPAGAGSDTLYASVAQTGFNSGLLALEKSSDSGQTWTALSNVPDYLKSSDAQGGYDNVVGVDPNNPNLVFAAGAGGSHTVEESADGGQTWYDITAGFGPGRNGLPTLDGTGPHADHHAMTFADGILIDGNDGGVFALTTNVLAPDPSGKFTGVTQASWTSLNTNLNITQFTGVALDPTDPSVVYGGAQDNGTDRLYGGVNWFQTLAADGGFVRADPTNAQLVYGTFSYGVLDANGFARFFQKSTDGGQTWQDAASGIPTSDPANFYPPYVLDPSNSQRLLLGTNQIYETVNGATPDPNYSGSDWHPLQANNNFVFPAKIDSLAIAPTDGNTVYASAGRRLWVTSDDGQDWTEITPKGVTGNSLVKGTIKGIAVDPADSKSVYITVASSFTSVGHVFVSGDGGSSWFDVTGNLPASPANAVALFPKDRLILVGTDVGVYATNALIYPNTQWIRYGSGQPNAQVVDLETATINGQDILAAGTHGRGVWETLLTGIPQITLQPLQAVEGQFTTPATVATFRDPGQYSAGDFTATVFWAINAIDTLTAANGGIVDNGDGSFSVVDSHLYHEEVAGIPIIVTVTDSTGGSQSKTAGFSIADAPLNITSFTPPTVATEGAATGLLNLATFTDANPYPDSGDYTATVSWGDGQSDTLTVANGGIVDNGSGIFTVQAGHAYLEGGNSLPFTVTVADAGGASATATSTVRVADYGLSIIASAPPSAVEGLPTGPIALIAFTDGDPDASAYDYTATVSWGDGSTDTMTASNGGIVNFGNNAFAVQAPAGHTYAEEGAGLTFSVQVQDAGGASAATAAAISVADAPLAFTSSSIPSVVAEGQSTGTMTLATFTDQDPSGSPGDFSAVVFWGDGGFSVLVARNGGIVANPDGSLSVVGSHTYDETLGGSYQLQILDAGNSTVLGPQIPLQVFDLPIFLQSVTPPPNPTEAASTGTVTLATFFDNNPSPSLLDYTATVSWGDGATDQLSFFGSNIVANPDGSFSVIGSHTYLEDGAGTFSVQVQDDTGPTDFRSAPVQIADAPLTLQSLTPPQGALVGVATGLLTVATFTDANPSPDPNDLSATVQWGDGTTVYTYGNGLVPNPDGSFAVLASHTYTQPLTNAPFVVTAQDQGGSLNTATGAVTVAIPLTASGTTFATAEGAPVSSVTAATFTDSQNSGFSATVSWGDGDTTAAVRIVTDPSAPHLFDVLASKSHPYAEGGTYAVGVTVQDSVGGSSSVTSTAAVSDPSLTASGTSIKTTEGAAFKGIVATFTDADTGDPVTSYTAVINWGDGTTATGTVGSTTVKGRFIVQGNHIYADEGSYAVRVLIGDAGGSASANGSAAVADAALRAGGKIVHATEGLSFSGTVATFADKNAAAPASDFTATVTWGDGQTSTGTVVATGAGSFAVLGSNTYAEEGNYTVGVKVTDVGGSSAATTATAAALDARLTAAGVALKATAGLPFSGTAATFTDANPKPDIKDFTATIVWGDGHTSTGTVVANPAGGFAVLGNNTYATAGTYAVKVAIADAGGATAKATSTATVSRSAQISFDTHNLSLPQLLLDNTQVLNNGVSPSITLALGTHTLTELYTGASVQFTVAADGTVNFDPSLSGVLSGRGTTTLVVNGVTVTVDATRLSVPLLLLNTNQVNEKTSAPFTITALPGLATLSEYYTGAVVQFTITANGTVSYDPSLEGVLTGAGTSTLTIHGATVTVDAHNLSMPFLYLNTNQVVEQTNARFTITVLPGLATLTGPYIGAMVQFTVAADGTVTYDPSLEGVLTGAGTSSLTVHGVAVTINATALTVANIILDYRTIEPTAAPFTVLLLPGTQLLTDFSGTGVTFVVNPDGTLRFPASEDTLLSLLGNVLIVLALS